jgi:glutamate-1-semialdehyde 2,1-aminomutase
MPFGSSTCSKRALYPPEEPGVVVKGKGCRIWDADGREYIDFRHSLGPITLGYRFPAVDRAIRRQLGQGIVFGHPHPLECEVAELLCEVIPCAEQARFLKTGSEAVAACIRLARHVTGRDHVVQIGYNGWLNSLAAGGRVLPGQVTAAPPPGVPACLASLHHVCPWNDVAALRRLLDEYPGQIAAVVVASAYHSSTEGAVFYPAVRELTRQHGSLLILDEIVTGFRVALGGVQEYFGVVPDLAVFAKGIANGMPLAAYVGRREIMEEFEKVIVSSTYGGETLSLAAAKAAIGVYRDEDVIGHLWQQGIRLGQGLAEIFTRHGISAEVVGYPPCACLQPTAGAPPDLLERLFRAAYRNGLSIYNNLYISFSHSPADIDEALERWEQACRSMTVG